MMSASIAFTTRPELAGTFGMATSTHWIASSVAMGILEQGGNAFDAAVAGGFVLQVVEPHLNGPGGEVPILVHDVSLGGQGDLVSVICGQGVSPRAATRDHFNALDLDLVPATGLLPAVVPGAFGAWLKLLAEHGTMNLSEVLAPAIHYAEHGYPLVGRIANAMATVRDLFQTEWPTSAEIYCNGNTPKAGDIFTNKPLAATWQRLLKEADAGGGDRLVRIERARRAWYEGFIASAVHDYYTTAKVMDTTGQRNGGLLTGDDMAAWSATRERPATFEYHGTTVVKCGPWSQGPVMLQNLALLRDLPINEMPAYGPDFIHVVTEAAKLAYADREAWYGDTDKADVHLAALLSEEYTAQRAALIADTANGDLRPGSVCGEHPQMPAHRVADENSINVAALLGAGEPTVAKNGEPQTDPNGAMRGDTCHIDVVDRWGNMVAATPSGGWFQSSPVVPGLGFSITTRAQMFWLQDGLASTLVPNRRPRTTLTPSMALRDGKPYMAWGTPGGDQQDQWSLTFLLRTLHHGMNLQEAIDAPSFHSEHWQSSFWPREASPNKLVVEGRIPKATVVELRRRGHDVEVGDDWSEGRLSAVSITHRGAGRILRAAANPRGMQGYAVGR